jgi:hypothetical protein
MIDQINPLNLAHFPNTATKFNGPPKKKDKIIKPENKLVTTSNN